MSEQGYAERKLHWSGNSILLEFFTFDFDAFTPHFYTNDVFWVLAKLEHNKRLKCFKTFIII